MLLCESKMLTGSLSAVNSAGFGAGVIDCPGRDQCEEQPIRNSLRLKFDEPRTVARPVSSRDTADRAFVAACPNERRASNPMLLNRFRTVAHDAPASPETTDVASSRGK
jgi:hypothetical protein